jgi:methylamine dehydrogenase accessory protein MauD
MTETLLISNLLLWLVVICLCVVVVALVRQVGVLHERVAPAGALALAQGPKVGAELQRFDLTTLDGQHIAIGGVNAAGRSTLLFFLSPTCPVCKTLLPVLKSSRRSESHWLEIVLVSDGDLDEQRRFVTSSGLGSFPYIVSTALGVSLRIGRLPYVVLADEHGVITAQGLVNSREHLESIFEAKERGVASIQQYLEQQSDKVA